MSNSLNFKNIEENPNFSNVKDIHPQDVVDNKASIRLVDVRRPDEYIGELGHIDGAQLLVLDTLPQRIEELKNDEAIVFICRSGNRSAQAANFALENGYSQVFNMKGGMLLWNELGLPITQDE